MHDLAVVVTAMNEASWLRTLLPTVAASQGEVSFELVVADIESTDDTASIVDRFPFARRVPVINGGFAHANNVATATTDARYVLFLNPDTEIVSGTLASIVAEMDRRPEVGLAGVRQLTPDGSVYATMRRFTTPGRRLAEALGCERLAPRLGQRVLDTDRYDCEISCDWTIGSFMLIRREALESAGMMDERFFFTSEEQDLCVRVRQAGWDIRHLPHMTIVHHVGKRGVNVRFAQQSAFAEMQFATKHFRPMRRRAFQAALALNHALRLGSLSTERRRAARAALDATLGRNGSPFRDPPPTAVPPDLFVEARRGRAV
jgi:N-acetylglucosaminyl-diphospho-decaprenol L-rhamnosyltransferase